jgi:hypothetical protein
VQPEIDEIKENIYMESQNISKAEMKELMKEAMISVLTERSDLLANAVSEAILDMKIGLAIEEGDTGEFVPESEIFKKLAE